MEITSHNHKLTIVISDDGIGFDKNESPKGNGLLNMEKRIQEVNGSINFDRNENGGTQIKIIINNR